MSVVDRLSGALGRKDEVANVEVGRQLAREKDREGVAELVSHLEDKNVQIRRDCLKALYEAGAIDPDIIADHVDAFASLLDHKDNRTVWGGMIALGALVSANPKGVWRHLSAIAMAIDKGSVITQDHGVLVLALLSAHNHEYAAQAFPLLIYRLRVCPAKQIPQYAEKALKGVNEEFRAELVATLLDRWNEMTERQQGRVRKVLKSLEAVN